MRRTAGLGGTGRALEPAPAAPAPAYDAGVRCGHSIARRGLAAMGLGLGLLGCRAPLPAAAPNEAAVLRIVSQTDKRVGGHHGAIELLELVHEDGRTQAVLGATNHPAGLTLLLPGGAYRMRLRGYECGLDCMGHYRVPRWSCRGSSSLPIGSTTELVITSSRRRRCRLDFTEPSGAPALPPDRARLTLQFERPGPCDERHEPWVLHHDEPDVHPRSVDVEVAGCVTDASYDFHGATAPFELRITREGLPEPVVATLHPGREITWSVARAGLRHPPVRRVSTP